MEETQKKTRVTGVHGKCTPVMQDALENAICRMSSIATLGSFNIHHAVYKAIAENNTRWLANMFNGRPLELKHFFDDVSYTQRREASSPETSEFMMLMERNGVEAIDGHHLRYKKI